MQAAVNYKETRTAPFERVSIEPVEENWVVSARAHLRSLANFNNLIF